MTGTAGRRVEWDCLFCGSTGVLPDGEEPDAHPCPSCGEPVFPR